MKMITNMKIDMIAIQRSIRKPVSKIGVIVHRPIKGKGSYVRNKKHKNMRNY
jgi:hypothetical protein